MPRCPDAASALSEAEIGAARGLRVEASRAASTRRAYDSNWRGFAAWCHARGARAPAAAPVLVVVYRRRAPPLAWRRPVARALAAIAHAHKRAGLIPPHRTDGAR